MSAVAQRSRLKHRPRLRRRRIFSRRGGRTLINQSRTTASPHDALPLLPQAFLMLGCATAVVVAFGGFLPGQIFRPAVVGAATYFAIRMDRWLGLRLRAVLAIAFGLTGTVLGCGIGIPHTVSDGLSLRATAGLVALLLGAPTLALGLITLIRTIPRRQGKSRPRLLAICCIPLSLAFFVGPLIQTVAAVNPPPTHLGLITPAARGMRYDDVTFTTSDGVTLRGWYVPSRNRAAVVLVHDTGTTRSSVLAHAVELARQGYGTLLFDLRGHGASDGDAMELCWRCERDVTAAVSYLSKRRDVDPTKIGVMGLGRGGEVALTAAAADRRIAAVVAEGIGRRTPVDTITLPLSPLGWLQGINELTRYGFTTVLRQSFPPRSLRGAIKRTAPRWIMLIAEKKSLDASRIYQKVSPNNVVVWELPRTPDTQAYEFHTTPWEQQVGSFFRDTLYPRVLAR